MIFWQKSKEITNPSLEHVFFCLFNRYKIVKRDNDNVYFEKVPSLTSLPAVQGKWNGNDGERMKCVRVYQGVVVAKSQAFDCHDPDVSGPDIFQKLVPMVSERRLR